MRWIPGRSVAAQPSPVPRLRFMEDAGVIDDSDPALEPSRGLDADPPMGGRERPDSPARAAGWVTHLDRIEPHGVGPCISQVRRQVGRSNRGDSEARRAGDREQERVRTHDRYNAR